MIDKDSLLGYVCNEQGHVTAEDIQRQIAEARQRGDTRRIPLLVISLKRLTEAQLCGDGQTDLQAS